MEKPYLILSCQDDGTVTVRGTPHCSLGHQIEHTPGRKPDGIYVEWTWDGQKLIVENDRYGMYPLYYFCRGREIGISPSLVRLLAEGGDPELDYEALAVFLRLGFFLAEDTPFHAIRALPPNATFLWQDGQLTVSGKRECGRPQPEISYEQALDRFNDLVRQAVKRRLTREGSFSLPLSGGRDSRQILFALQEFGQAPEFCMTSTLFPPQHQQDIQIAKLLTGRLHLSHEVFEQTNTFFQAEIQRNLVTGFCSDELQESLGCALFFRGRTRVIYDGLAGGVLSAGFFVNAKKQGLLEAGKIRELADEILNGWGHVCLREEVFPQLFHKEFARQMTRECAIDRVEQELRRYLHTPNPIMQCMLWNRTRREITLSPHAILWEIPTVFCPYLDFDLYDFMSGLSPRYFMDRTFHNQAIRRGYPEYRDIPFEDSKAKGVDPTAFRQHFVRDLLFYLAKEKRCADQHLRVGYLVPRLLRYLVKADNWWLSPNLILYMTQMEKVRTLPKKDIRELAMGS